MLVSACTGRALEDSVISQGNSITYIEQQMVLDNLEMFRQNANARPWHIKITSGVVSVNDEINPSFTYAWSPITRTAGVSATRSVQLQWSVLPVTDPAQLIALRKLYQANVGVKQGPEGTPLLPSCPKSSFAETFEEGLLPPANVPHGSYAGISIWVRGDDAAKFCFDNILNDTINAAPVTGLDLSTPIPGAFPLVGRRP
jgi:hypothetical protein